MIRLVILDFGDTIFHAVEDGRSKATGKWEVLERDDAGRPTIVAPPSRPGIAEATFDNVQEVLHELRRRGTWLSVASSADVEYTPNMVEAFHMGALFRHAFMAKGDINGDCSRKGDWIEAIIHSFNIAECQDKPLQPSEVLFVDDLIRCLQAATKSVAGIKTCIALSSSEQSFNYLLDVIDEINEEDE